MLDFYAEWRRGFAGVAKAVRRSLEQLQQQQQTAGVDLKFGMTAP
jgi:hypothetical protein